VNAPQLPWIQRAANTLTPEAGDAVILALAVAVIVSIIAIAVFGWLQ